MSSGYEKVNRLELIDHSPCKACNGKQVIKDATGSQICPECQGMGMKGRTVIFWDDNKQVELSLQDDNRTLKVFISNKKPSMALDDLIDDLDNPDATEFRVDPTKPTMVLEGVPGTDELSENEA